MNPYFKDMGVGVGLRPAHHSDFLEQRPSSVTWIEVISENYMPWQNQTFGKPFHTLSRFREDYPVAMHGVSLNIGSVDPLDFDYLSRLKALIDAIDPFVVSDHMSWTGMNGQNLHDLLPVPYTEEALNLILQKLARVQDYLGRPILLENPSSYLEFRGSEMSEPEFLQKIVKSSGCGLLLDINNVFVSSVNHGFDPFDYLRQIPGERVGQIHLAGHSKMDGFLIDTHDAPVCDEVWDLYSWYISQIGRRSTMIERDGHIPEWQELEKEILRIGAIHGLAKKSG